MWECVHLYMCEFISVEGHAWVLYLESPMKAVVDCEDIHQHRKYIVGILLLVLVAGWCVLVALRAFWLWV